MSYAAAAGGIPVNITDDAGVGGVLIVYVENGTGWLAASGGSPTWTTAGPNPLPAACFSTTRGSLAKTPLVIPAGIAGGRIYLAIATPNPSASVIPNPFGDVNAGLGGPNPGYQAAPFPWDKLEFGTILANNPVIDTTQVDFLGLPLELSVPSSTTATPMPDSTMAPAGSCVANSVSAGSTGPYGVTSCKFAQIFSTVGADLTYSKLAYTAYFNGNASPLDMQVVSPSKASFTSFDWTALSNYVQTTLASYKTTPRLFTNNVSGAQTGTWTQAYYCASSDGSANFTFTNIGMSTACPGATPNPAVSPNPFVLPAALFIQATVTVPDLKTDTQSNQCVANELFGQPYGLSYVDGAANDPTLPTGELFATNDAFAMWKALTADFNYGMAQQTGTHPIGQVSPPPITPAQLFKDAAYNTYDKVMHDNFNGNLAYGIPYDDLYDLYSGVAMSASGGSIVIRINPIPSATSVTPGSKPNPAATPATCPVVAAGVGSY
jgi:hypothetical protein